MQKPILFILLLSVLTILSICINISADPGPFQLDIFHRDPLPPGQVSVTPPIHKPNGREELVGYTQRVP